MLCVCSQICESMLLLILSGLVMFVLKDVQLLLLHDKSLKI